MHLSRHGERGRERERERKRGRNGVLSPFSIYSSLSLALYPNRALCLPPFSHFLIVNKPSLSLSLSLSLASGDAHECAMRVCVSVQCVSVTVVAPPKNHNVLAFAARYNKSRVPVHSGIRPLLPVY